MDIDHPRLPMAQNMSSVECDCSCDVCIPQYPDTPWDCHICLHWGGSHAVMNPMTLHDPCRLEERKNSESNHSATAASTRAKLRCVPYQALGDPFSYRTSGTVMCSRLVPGPVGSSRVRSYRTGPLGKVLGPLGSTSSVD